MKQKAVFLLAFLRCLFLYQPVLHVVGLSLALEVELHVVQRIAYFLEGRLWVEILIAGSKQLADVTQAPPLGLF